MIHPGGCREFEGALKTLQCLTRDAENQIKIDMFNTRFLAVPHSLQHIRKRVLPIQNSQISGCADCIPKLKRLTPDFNKSIDAFFSDGSRIRFHADLSILQ